jgi:lipid II:glycine glycyltransferase (peptidoglycan interpeptide bridge formation enzyme)
MSLKSKWRNSLRKSEKLGVSVVRCESNQEVIKFLVKNYQDLKDSHGFDGLTSQFISLLAQQRGPHWSFNIFLAHEEGLESNVENNIIGMVVTIISGCTSLYLLGVTGDKGRQMQANSTLLWHAILDAKRAGCEWFDVGGLSDQTPKGIADFKKGLNAITYELVGEWQWF